MNFDQYQKATGLTNIYPEEGMLQNLTLGLCNEAGELAGKVKKISRDKGGVVTDADRVAMMRELGDVLWYLSELATELDLDLFWIARDNIAKLQSRQDRGVLGGSGDDR